jgi:hypothetical protein
MATKSGKKSSKKSTKQKVGEAIDAQLAAKPSEGSSSAVEEIEKRLAMTHVEHQRPVSAADAAGVETEPPLKDDEAVDPGSPGGRRTVSEPPSEEEAREAVEGIADTPTSVIVGRALRFMQSKEPYVRVYPTMVVGAGQQGTVYSPFPVPLAGLQAGGHVVDGVKLFGALKTMGPNAVLQPRGDGGLDVVADGEVCKIKPYGGTVPEALPLPQNGEVNFVAVSPSRFRTAEVFAGDDKIEPAHLSGVAVVNGAALATDRRAAVYVPDFVLQGAPTGTFVIPRDAFKDIQDETVWLGVDAKGRITIGIPSTGEYRIFRSYSESFPDIAAVMSRQTRVAEIGVQKAALLHALRKMTVVQSRLSYVHLTLRSTAPTTLAMKGGNADIAEYETHVPISLLAGALPDITVVVSATYLLKLAKVALGDVVRLSFGATERDSITVYETYQAVVLPLVL